MIRALHALAVAAICVLGAEAQADVNLTLEGTLATGRPNACVVRGDLGYLIGAGSFFDIIDISDPGDINLISSTELPGAGGGGLLLEGDLAYLMEGTPGISIYDITDSASPIRLGATSTGGSARTGVLVGSLLYVAAGDAGLKVVDVTNPATPYVAGGFTLTDHSVHDVTVEGGSAYAMAVRSDEFSSYPKLMVLSLANPASPTLVDSHEYDESGSTGEILVHNSVIYMTNGGTTTGGSTLYSATYSPGTGIVPVGELVCPTKYITVDENGTLFGSGWNEFASVDISQPDAMAVISILPTTRWGPGFNVDSGRTLLPQSDHGALLLDVSDPAQMTELAHYWPPSDAVGLTYRDGLLFIAGKQTWVVDPTDPANMAVVAENSTDTGISDWVAQPDGFGVAYIAGPGIRAMDIATGSTLGTIQPQPPAQTLDVSFWGTTVYSGQSWEGFAILDFSDPTAPTQIGGFTDHYVRYVAAYHDVLYAAGDQLLEAFDVSDPTSPVLKFSTPVYRVGGLVVEGGRLFHRRGSDGVFIFGLDDPLSPEHLGTIPAQSSIGDVDVRGIMAAVADRDHGAFLYDIRDPSTPVLVGSCSRPGRVDKVALSDDTLFLNVDLEGVYAYSISSSVTGTPSLSSSGAFLRAGINPAMSVAEFSFGTDWGDEVELAIYDLAGRRVRTFRQSTRPGEPSWIAWNGRDDANRSVASGVYVVRLSTSRSTITDKITFIR